MTEGAAPGDQSKTTTSRSSLSGSTTVVGFANLLTFACLLNSTRRSWASIAPYPHPSGPVQEEHDGNLSRARTRERMYWIQPGGGYFCSNVLHAANYTGDKTVDALASYLVGFRKGLSPTTAPIAAKLYINGRCTVVSPRVRLSGRGVRRGGR